MENKWNRKKALKQLLYMVLYFIFYLLVCMLGSVHPIMFVVYQITAGFFLTGVLVKGFSQMRTSGVSISFAAIILLAFLAIGDFTPWHVIPILILTVLAEVIGFIMDNAKWKTILVKSVIMSFTTFGYYGQIWFNRDFTYEAAVEEMPPGYADGLMSCSPGWTLPLVIIIGIIVAILTAELAAKIWKIEKD